MRPSTVPTSGNITLAKFSLQYDGARQLKVIDQTLAGVFVALPDECGGRAALPRECEAKTLQRPNPCEAKTLQTWLCEDRLQLGNRVF
ncbi:hypothetical protein GCM10027027_02060 [Neomicrococcus lactis]